MKLYGVPLSQPVRAVLWPCLIKRVPFTFQLTVPGMAGKSGTKGDSFRANFPLGTVPAIEDGELRLSESGAILLYLAKKHHWKDLDPEDIASSARMHEYMAWSQRKTRQASTLLFGPHVRADLRPKGPAWLEEGLTEVKATVSAIESHWLGHTPFIAGQAPTIADFTAYEELSQLGAGFGAVLDFAAFPNVHRWLGMMASLPHHDAVHASIKELGPLDALLALDQRALGAKLAAATKAGMAGIERAISENEKGALAR